MNAMEQIEEKTQTDELILRLNEMADEENQGESFRSNDYLVLYSVGILLPIIIMLIGWFLK